MSCRKGPWQACTVTQHQQNFGCFKELSDKGKKMDSASYTEDLIGANNSSSDFYLQVISNAFAHHVTIISRKPEVHPIIFQW